MWNYITNQNYVRTLANLQLSFIKFYVLLNSAWFLYFFLFSSWLWKVVSLIIAYKIGLWWSSLMMYRKVASCLLQSFLCARKQREEDIVNFSYVHCYLMKSLVTSVKKKVWWLIFLWQWCRNLSYVFLSYYSAFSVDDILC